MAFPSVALYAAGTDQQAYKEDGLKVIVQAGPTRADPFGQIVSVAWKAKGKDGNQYGNFFETSEFNYVESEYIYTLSEMLLKTIKQDFAEVPQLSHIAIPSLKQIERRIKLSLTKT